MRDKKLLRWVASKPCIHCGIEGYSQVAHSNLAVHGKGMGLKSSDEFTFPLCCDRPGVQGCHSKLDQHKLLPPDEVEATTAMWIAVTHVR